MASLPFGDNNNGLQIGDNRGSINAEFHLPLERPETPPNPLSTVPFTRDPDFVSRKALLHWIRKKSSVPGSRIALVGFGGVGKSQLAIEYSYQIRSESPATWVFWIHASNEARFEQSFRDIADQVKIPGRQDPKVNIFQLVENRLRDEKTGNWVCILDNVDDDKLLCSFQATGREDSIRGLTNASTKPLLEYIPRGRNGSIIITSRTRDIALKLVDRKDLIEVQPMESSEALELLQRKFQEAGESQESQQLVESLEFMPLAIVQAASYIQNRAPRYSVSQYLRDFQVSDREAIRLLKKGAGYLSRDWEAKNSILVTWQISFDYIRQTKPSAAELLSLMSFFDRQGIPENLIRHQSIVDYISHSELLSDSSDAEASESDTTTDFEDDIITLKDYSFISISENSLLFTMHRLVQLTTRAWLKTHGQIDLWREKFISNLNWEFPTGRYKNWGKCYLLFPHVRSAMSQRPKSRESLLKWATLLHKGAWYAWESGHIADMREMALRSRNERASLQGEEHDQTLDSTAMLASAYQLDGRWKEAEQLKVQVMEFRKSKFGEGHLDTLASMANLALTFWNQGRWEEAEQLEAQVMETSKTKLGEDHPDTLRSIASLASTYWNQGRWEEAEQLEVRVMKISKTKLGEDHPDTLTSMGNLASTYRKQGRWKEAEELELLVMETSKTKLGEDHPDTLTSMGNLASTYRKQGRWKEAEELELLVMETSKTKLGEDHPDTLTSMGNLASTYRKQGRWKEAEELELLVMETSKTKLGEDHPDTLMSMANLAFTWKSSGRDAEAISLLRGCLAKQKKILGSSHPNTSSHFETLLAWERNNGADYECLN
ncbi:hypothetical protein N7526_007421 [Penicillium atrosanguineum]|nr:hypothetical protein N7526_007421 [Penicillium atrosanguineum]